MTMQHKGLAKLAEETGELQQVIGKMLQYPNTPQHPDGSDLRIRLEEELADTISACYFVMEKMNLNHEHINFRAQRKLAKYEKWDAE